MKILGIHLLKGELRYTILKGTKQKPILIDKNRLSTISTSNIPELMDWFETNFNQLIAKLGPEKIAYRLTLNPKKDQLFSTEFPYGILNLICYKQNIPIDFYVPQSFKPSKLNQPKDIDIYSYCDQIFGQHPPYWDKNQKNSLLVAWFELP